MHFKTFQTEYDFLSATTPKNDLRVFFLRFGAIQMYSSHVDLKKIEKG